MEKGIKRLKEEVSKLRGYAVIIDGEDGEWEPVTTVSVEDIYELINQLDKLEVLSQEFINEKAVEIYADTADAEVHVAFRMRDLQNLLVPKQEKVKIERVWAEDIEDAEASGMTLFKAMNWMAIDSDEKEKQDLFARAWLDGYTVEEEPKYYAKLKDIQPLEGEWLTNLSSPNYYALNTKGLMLGEFLLDLVGMKTEASTHTLKDWERYGINNSNADFIKVEELEE